MDESGDDDDDNDDNWKRRTNNENQLTNNPNFLWAEKSIHLSIQHPTTPSIQLN